MLDELLNMGSVFDWVTPTVAFVEDFLYGPASDFGIPAQGGWDRGDIKRLLNSYGIHVWGLMYNINGDMLMFTVPKTRAKWTYHLLHRNGVPILYAPADVLNSLKKSNAPDVIDSAFNFLKKLGKELDL